MRHLGTKRPNNPAAPDGHRARSRCVRPEISARRYTVGRLLALSVLLAFGHTTSAQAQDTPSTQQATTQPVEVPEITSAELTLEALQTRISQLEAATDLAEITKVEAVKLYKQAVEQVGVAQNWATKVSEYRQGQEQAPSALEAVRERTARATTRPATQPADSIEATGNLTEMSAALAQAEADAKQRQEEARQLDAEARNRLDRTAAIPDLLAEANKRREEVSKQLGAPPATGEPPRLTMARRALLTSRKRAIEQEIESYQAELRFYNARSELLAARRELAKLLASEAQARVAAWQAAVDRVRQAEIREQQEQAERELQQAPGPIRDLAAENAELAAERSEAVKKNAALAERLAEVSARQAELATQQDTLQDNLKLEGMSSVIGPFMRRLRTELIQLQRYEREQRDIRRDFAAVQARIFKIEQDRLDLADIEERIAGSLENLPQEVSESRRARIESKLRELLLAQRDLLDQLRGDYERYATNLTDYLAATSGLLTKVDTLNVIINENAVWIRSTVPLYELELPRNVSDLGPQLVDVTRSLWRDVKARPDAYLLAALVLVLLFVVRPRLHRFQRDANKNVARVLSDRYSLTFGVIAAQMVEAAALPALLALIGWRMTQAAESAAAPVFELGLALGLSLRSAASYLFVLSLLQLTCREGGLNQVHFRWDGRATRRARSQLSWFKAVLVLVIVVLGTSERLPDPGYRDTVGRIAFMIVLAAMAVFAARLLRPRSGVLSARLRRNPGGVLDRTRYAWYGAGVGLPILLLVLSVFGYQYTALVLTHRMVQTVLLIVAVLYAHALMVRWLFVAQRRLAIEQARKQRASRDESQTEGAASEAPLIEEAKLDLVSIGDQTKRVLRSLAGFAVFVGVWATWADMLPALSFLGDVTLWEYVSETVQAGGEGEQTTQVVEEVERITLTDLVLSLIFVVITIVLTRNIPGLLEIAVLQRLPLDAGGRFAITSVARYLIIVAGAVMAFSAIGVGWSKVQWLIAAVTVGLGFGLQEIFANFVSGLILLIERPIRIGDTVTVGDIHGTVTRIRIRATTITDWDRKELIIPNKDFITGRVVNWTLSDQTVRIIVPVGIAYGSDTELAERLLHEVGRDLEVVLADPKPMVLFLGFGDNSLNFELRCYVSGIDKILSTKHILHMTIDRKFRAAGIEIAFPQRDVHIRTIKDVLPLRRAQQESPPEEPQPEGG